MMRGPEQDAVQAGLWSMAAIFGALGFTAALPVIVSGYLLAVVGGLVGMAAMPLGNDGERLIVALPIALLTAVFMATLAALAVPHLGQIVSALAVLDNDRALPFIMGVAGLMSRWLARKAVTGDWSIPSFGRRPEQ